MPAYVTSRIMPGTTLIHQGGNYEPDENGIDRGASPNTLLGGDKASNFTPARSTNLVQIEKYEEAHL
jgi:anaerobic dimethyl sulfoxide reductase subunit A